MAQMAWPHTEKGKFTSTKTTSNEQIKEGKRLHGKQKQRWHDVVNADHKSLDMVSTWRTKALNRNLW